MNIPFFAACIACILYCVLYGAYSVSERQVSQAVSIFTMAAIAAGATVVLAIVT